MSRGKWRKNSMQSVSFPSTDSPAIVDAATAPIAEIIAANESDAKQKKDVKKSADAVPEIFRPEQVAWVFDVYVVALSFIFSITLKADYKIIHDELKFEDAEKDAMAKPLARIASRYAPTAWAGMTAEIELITTLGIWSVTSFRRAQMVATADRERKQKEKNASTVSHMPRNQQNLA